MKSVDIIGQKFGRLTVLSLHHKTQRYKKDGSLSGYREHYLCKCDCGKNSIVEKYCLTKGITKSCGCYNIDRLKERNRKSHGMYRTRLNTIWNSMKNRCTRKNNKNYGGRGITVCNEWNRDFMAFYNWAVKNGYKENLTIDRIDVNGNYEPQNCRWITTKEQCRNTRYNRKITIRNETKCLVEWCEILNLNYKTVCTRLHRGWKEERALNLT